MVLCTKGGPNRQLKQLEIVRNVTDLYKSVKGLGVFF